MIGVYFFIFSVIILIFSIFYTSMFSRIVNKQLSGYMYIKVYLKSDSCIYGWVLKNEIESMNNANNNRLIKIGKVSVKKENIIRVDYITSSFLIIMSGGYFV